MSNLSGLFIGVVESEEANELQDLLKARDLSKLTKKVITNKKGKQQTVWVKNSEGAKEPEKGESSGSDTLESRRFENIKHETLTAMKQNKPHELVKLRRSLTQMRGRLVANFKPENKKLIGKIESLRTAIDRFREQVEAQDKKNLVNPFSEGTEKKEEKKPEKQEKERRGGPVDEHAKRELDLFAENDRQLFEKNVKPIIANMKRKIENGSFDAAKAPKLAQYYVDAAAKKYVAQFGSKGDKINSMFNAATREALAKDLAGGWEREIRNGEHGELKMKKAWMGALSILDGI